MLEPDTHLRVEEELKTSLKMDAKRIYITFLIFFLNHVVKCSENIYN